MSDPQTTLRERAIRATRERDRNRRTLRVPEWDADVHMRGSVTVAENHRYHRAASTIDPDTGEVAVNLSEVMVAAVIDKVEDEHGEPVFSDADRDFLLHEADSDLVSRLYAFVRGQEEFSPKRWRVTVD